MECAFYTKQTHLFQTDPIPLKKKKKKGECKTKWRMYEKIETRTSKQRRKPVYKIMTVF